MTSPSLRRRFQFSLRTLLIGVTLFAIPCWYVAGQAQIVRTRKAWRAEQIDGKPRDTYPATWRLGEGNSLPLIRRWLGDEELSELWICTEKDLAPAAALFPEAKVTFDPAR